MIQKFANCVRHHLNSISRRNKVAVIMLVVGTIVVLVGINEADHKIATIGAMLCVMSGMHAE